MNSSEIIAVKGDITEQKVDAIVNAANTSLSPGGGVDGAIRNAAGFEEMTKLLEPTIKLGGIQTGDAIITLGGALSAKYIIWTAGPIYKDGKYDEASNPSQII